MRVLLIAFYFPPAGGGGVQRALKLCKHLPEFGVTVHVLAPRDPKWLARDDALVEAIPAGTTVHRAPFPGPRSSLRASLLHSTHGWRRAVAETRYAYQRVLLPDRAVTWITTAVPAGVRIVRHERIDAVLTTSPPNSVHLVGEAVSAATGVPWVADFRDSWLVNPHRSYDHPGVRAKRVVETRMARSVVRRASRTTAVTDAIAAELGALRANGAAPAVVIPNGADFDDFSQLSPPAGDRLVLVHSGSFFGRRSPRPLLTAVRDLLDRRPELRGQLLVRFVGDLRPSDRGWASTLGIDDAWEETGFLPYRDSIAAQRAADVLLLLIPHNDGRGDHVLSGKVFEYLAARRPILAAVPPTGIAADLVRRLGAGEVVDPDDVAALSATLERFCDRRSSEGLPDIQIPAEERRRLSRRERAAEMASVLRDAMA